jgi:hypothetical protein
MCTDLLHAAKLRHGTDGFTSPPKEGMLRIFRKLGHPRNRDVHYRTHKSPPLSQANPTCAKTLVLLVRLQFRTSDHRPTVQSSCVRRPQFSSWTSLIFFLATACTPAVGPQNCLSSEYRLLLNRKYVKLRVVPRLGMCGGVQPLSQCVWLSAQIFCCLLLLL